MHFIGDVHGKLTMYLKMVSYLKDTIQLGDFGLGFGGNMSRDKMYHDKLNEMIADRHMILRGNHDNPAAYKNLPTYLGDYGMYKGIFFISGAYSIDKCLRTEGVTYWSDEELRIVELDKAISLFNKEKPSVVISHTCPLEIIGETSTIKLSIKSRTSQALQAIMDSNHKPKEWIFGHMHCSYRKKVKGINFVGLNEMELYTPKYTLPEWKD